MVYWLKKSWQQWVAGLVVLIVALLGIGYLLIQDNFHTVIPGQVYRSAQLSPAELRSKINEYHIRTVVNLRGVNRHKSWYRHEDAVVRQMQVIYYPVKMSAYQLPSLAIFNQLVNVLQGAPRPMLIHCEGGADRTGLASAIVLLLKNDSLQQAQAQISWRYMAFSKNSVGRLVLPYYRRWLQAKGKASTQTLFLQWAAQTQLGKHT